MGKSRLAALIRATAIAFVTMVVSGVGSGVSTPLLAQDDAEADTRVPSPKRDVVPVASFMNFEGGTSWGTFFGYGFSQEINGSTRSTDIASGGLRWSHLWSERFGGLLRGHPAFGVEVLPVVRFIEDERSTWAAGLNLLYEHHFSSRHRVRPVWKLGAGFLFANREIPEGETRHNFSLLTELGVDVLVSERMAVSVGYRFHHVSNADTGNRNPGFNAHTMMFGLSVYR